MTLKITSLHKTRSIAETVLGSIRKLRIWSHLLKKSLMENFIFCVVRHWNSFNEQRPPSFELEQAYL